MKFKVISTIIVIVIMLLTTLVYMASRNSGTPVDGEVQYEEVQY